MAAPGTQPTTEDLQAKVTPGEETKPQTGGSGGLAVMFANDPGFDKPPAGTYKTYRKMRRNPTLAMARIAATAPVKTADMTVTKKEGVNESQRQFLEDQISPLWRHLVGQATLALDYGWQSFEIVYGLENDGGLRHTLRKLKPLWPDQTEIQIDKATGAYRGLKQGNVVLQPEKTWRYSHEVEGTNWYGRSRNENVREWAWPGWTGTASRMAQYGRKVAGVIPVILYPEGVAKDSSGAEQDTFDIATRLLDRLGNNMQGIAMPNAFAKHAGDLLKKGVDISQLRPWLIEFLEPQGQHGGDFVQQLAYWDKQIARGWLVPERVFQEGEHGTKAEAGVHTDLVLNTAEEILQDIVDCANSFLIDRLGVLNFPNYKPGDVAIEQGPIIDTDRAFLRGIIEKVAGGAGLTTLLQLLDLEATMEQVGLPVDEDTEPPEGPPNVPANPPANLPPNIPGPPQQQPGAGGGGPNGPPQA